MKNTINTINKLTIILSLVMLLTWIPWDSGFATGQAVDFNFHTHITTVGNGVKPLTNGDIGVDYEILNVEFTGQEALTLSSGTSLSHVKVYSGQNNDETGNFHISLINSTTHGGIRLSLQSPHYQLKKHTLYRIHIPQGTLKNAAGNLNRAVTLLFVTKGENASPYEDSILVLTSPSDGGSQVDYQTKEIVLEFVDDIQLISSSGITITSEAMTEPALSGYRSVSPVPGTGNQIASFQTQVQGKKLILKANANALKDYAIYNIGLSAGTIKLKNSGEANIQNEEISITFTTDRILEKSYPAHNQTDVEVEPTLAFHFKYPVTMVDSGQIHNRIQLRTGLEVYPLSPGDITLSQDGKILYISINDKISMGKQRLRRSTLYEMTLGAGAVKIKDHSWASTGEDIVNHPISAAFITRSQGQAPVAVSFNSTAIGNEDIRNAVTTQLDGSGRIFIKFSEQVQIDKESGFTDILQATKLYKLPKAEDTDHDPWGKRYDKTYLYTQAPYGMTTGSYAGNVIPLESVAVNTTYRNILEIKPKVPFEPRQQYHLVLDRDLIEDVHGYNLEEDVSVLLWTKAATTTPVPDWQLKELTKHGITIPLGTVVSGVPRYGIGNGADVPEAPLILNVTGEIIPPASNQRVDTDNKTVYADGLKNITLLEGYTDKKVSIEKIKLEYYYEGGIKKTRIFLYPAYRDPDNPNNILKTRLDPGKRYRLAIPVGTFETRGKQPMKALDLQFITMVDSSEGNGIIHVETGVTRDGIMSSISTLDIEAKEMSFLIRGHNFTNNIGQIDLQPVAGGRAVDTVSIDAAHTELVDPTTIRVRIKDSARTKLSQESSVGTYRVSVLFQGGSTATGENALLQITSRGRPVLHSAYPQSINGFPWFNPKALRHDVNDTFTSGIYFIKASFRDPGGNLRLSGLEDLKGSVIRPANGMNSLLDTDFINKIMDLEEPKRGEHLNKYVFVRKTDTGLATLYIPIKELRPQTTYEVSLPAQLLSYSNMIGDHMGNDAITWSFVTSTTPYVSEISAGSVPENYDGNTTITIYGDFFHLNTISVYFNDIPGRIGEKSRNALQVFLPGGSSRLKAGVYDVIVQNDSNHQRTLYGALTVVKAGSNPPTEAYTIKKVAGKGEVRSDVKLSEDTLILSYGFTNRAHLKVDLDEWMGEEVLVRAIQFEGYWRNRIGILETKSKWADLTLYEVSLEDNNSRSQIKLILGRTEPETVKILRDKLKGKTIRSEFIQVTGENFKMKNVFLSIPIQRSSSKDLKVYRYDEETRGLYEEAATVNLVDQRVELLSPNKGIFVVIEGK